MMNTFALSEVGEDVELQDKKEQGDIAYLNVEGDGVFDNFYEAMWTRQEPHTLLWLPHTVVFKFNKPTAWYHSVYSAQGELTLIKKKISALKMITILSTFQQEHDNECDIVAMFVSQGEFRSPYPTRVKYIRSKDLQNFLLHEEKEDGVLQQFVRPQRFHCATHSNNTMRVVWSPIVCVVERRENTRSLLNTKHNVYQRAETFEGSHVHSVEKPLTSSSLLNEIRDKVTKLVRHFEFVAGRRVSITRLTLFLRGDAKGVLDLLWVESIRLKQNERSLKPSVRGTLDDRVPKFRMDNRIRVPPLQQQGDKLEQCKLCENKCPPHDLCTVTYQTLLASIDDSQLTQNVPTGPDTTSHLRMLTFDNNSFVKAPNKSGILNDVLDERQLLKDPMKALEQALVEARLREAEDNDGLAGKRAATSLSNYTTVSSLANAARSIGSIPWFFQKLHPYMTLKDYAVVKKRADFLRTTTTLCPSCFVNLTMGLSENELTRNRLDENRKHKLAATVRTTGGASTPTPFVPKLKSLHCTSPRMNKSVPSNSNTHSRLGGSTLLAQCSRDETTNALTPVSATLVSETGVPALGARHRMAGLRNIALKQMRQKIPTLGVNTGHNKTSAPSFTDSRTTLTLPSRLGTANTMSNNEIIQGEEM
eukprot:PhM_4_TR2631/c0_g1_i1/m.50656